MNNKRKMKKKKKACFACPKLCDPLDSLVFLGGRGQIEI
jgi:hypothetical protein